MQIGIFIAAAIASSVGVIITIRYLLGIESRRQIIKIGVFRSIIKVVVGLFTGFGMALLLNSTQYLESAAVELSIIISTFSFGMLISLKMYQIMLKKWFALDQSLLRLFKIGVLEYLIGSMFLAVVLAVVFHTNVGG
tara:strand:+ start:95 stop:505 length:411 start_codon:yes stop_codon:yes gene_type:complete